MTKKNIGVKPEKQLYTVRPTGGLFEQDGDCVGGDVYQSLEVEVSDGGGGCFLVLKTDRWALDPEDLDKFIADLRTLLPKTEEIK